MISLFYAYLTRLGWRQSATHPNPPLAAYSPLTADVVTIPTHVDQVTPLPSWRPTTIDGIMADVDRMATGRTRYAGSPVRYDEQLVAEVRRLRVENAELCADLADAKYREEHDGY